MRDDLQELVLAAPATLVDAEFTLLAFCAHDDSAAGALDAVRISELTGLDLADGDARLLLHASLRAARFRTPPVT